MKNLDIDLSITISVIIALAAIISPILTAIINNSHQKKMKKLELEQKHYEETVLYQKGIFEDYLRKAGNHIGTRCRNIKTLEEYNNAYLVALLYAPIDLQKKMQNAHQIINPLNSSTAITEFEQLIPTIQEYLNTL